MAIFSAKLHCLWQKCAVPAILVTKVSKYEIVLVYMLEGFPLTGSTDIIQLTFTLYVQNGSMYKNCSKNICFIGDGNKCTFYTKIPMVQFDFELF